MNHNLTLGSLFDGSGGFPLGGLISGITPVWASEIEPFPIRVTTRRLPFMKHYGDISQMDGGKIEPVDIICFGSPCTDMSIAGRRAGLDGKQSVLFYEAIRIIKEMRCATNGKYPRWICWENVPGAFSSNGGRDFKAVLDSVIGIIEEDAQVPLPEKGKWPYADCYVGDGWSVAYRTLDAQHWGVPQRRKRIFLVADFADRRAGKVLFESEGLSGYSAEGFRAWQRAARGAAEGTHPTGVCFQNGGLSEAPAQSIVLNDQGGNRIDVTDDVTATLRAEAHHPPVVMDDTVLPLENHPADGRIRISDASSVQTLTSRMGTGGNNVPLVMKIRCGCEGGGKGALIQVDKSATLSCNNDQTLFEPRVFGICSKDSNAMKSDNPRSGFYEAETTRTLDGNGGNPSCNQGGVAIVESDNVYALTTGGFTQVIDNMAPTVLARDYKDPTTVCYDIGRDTFNQGKNAKFAPTFMEELQPTLVAKGPGAIQNGYTVRRLTPTECARLQGFPDWWCDDLGTEEPAIDDIRYWYDVFETHRRIVGSSSKPKTLKQIRKWLTDPHSDAAEYKMWGNGVALPCVAFVLSGIVYCTQNDR